MEPSKTSESHLTGHANVIEDFFHKWLLVINSFASLKFSLINLVFELIFQKKILINWQPFMKWVYKVVSY